MTKNIVHKLYILALPVVALMLTGCSPGPAQIATSIHDPSNPSAPEGASPPKGASPIVAASEGNAAAVTYTCPMHSEVATEAPGACPKCGMALVPKK